MLDICKVLRGGRERERTMLVLELFRRLPVMCRIGGISLATLSSLGYGYTAIETGVWREGRSHCFRGIWVLLD